MSAPAPSIDGIGIANLPNQVGILNAPLEEILTRQTITEA